MIRFDCFMPHRAFKVYNLIIERPLLGRTDLGQGTAMRSLSISAAPSIPVLPVQNLPSFSVLWRIEHVARPRASGDGGYFDMGGTIPRVCLSLISYILRQHHSQQHWLLPAQLDIQATTRRPHYWPRPRVLQHSFRLECQCQCSKATNHENTPKPEIVMIHKAAMNDCLLQVVEKNRLPPAKHRESDIVAVHELLLRFLGSRGT